MLFICLFFSGLFSRELTGFLIGDEECRVRYLRANLESEYRHADKIIDTIYLGDVCAAHNRTWLVENDISLVVNVAHEWNASIYSGIDFLYFPFDDATDLDIKATRRLINNIASRLVDKVDDCASCNILIHCNLGISRSSTIVIRYLQSAYHMTYRTAVKFIKEKRPVAKPNTLFKKILINMDL